MFGGGGVEVDGMGGLVIFTSGGVRGLRGETSDDASRTGDSVRQDGVVMKWSGPDLYPRNSAKLSSAPNVVSLRFLHVCSLIESPAPRELCDR